MIMEMTRMLDNDDKELMEHYCDQIIIEKYRREKLAKQKQKGAELNPKALQKREHGYRQKLLEYKTRMIALEKANQVSLCYFRE